MKSIGEMIAAKPVKPKGGLSKKTKSLLMSWALEAHQLDSSQPVSYYYQLFLDNLRKRYTAATKEQFFKHGIIEV